MRAGSKGAAADLQRMPPQRGLAILKPAILKSVSVYVMSCARAMSIVECP